MNQCRIELVDIRVNIEYQGMIATSSKVICVFVGSLTRSGHWVIGIIWSHYYTLVHSFSAHFSVCGSIPVTVLELSFLNQFKESTGNDRTITTLFGDSL